MNRNGMLTALVMAGLLAVTGMNIGCQSSGDERGSIFSGPTFSESRRDAVAEQRRMMEDYVSGKQFGKSLPALTGSRLERYCSSNYTPAQNAELRKAVEDEFVRCRSEIVIPEWIKFQASSLEGSVMALVAEAQKAAALTNTNGFDIARAKFADAREIIWNQGMGAELDGKPLDEVNDPVHKFALRLLTEKVNVAHWPLIELEMRQISERAIAEGKPEKGLQQLKDYPRVRAYTAQLDARVKAIANELVHQGVPTPATEAIQEATCGFMNEASRLADRVDITKDGSRVEKGRGIRPDDTQYKRLLEEYRNSLQKYGCTKANADKLIEWLSKKAAELFADLPLPAPDRVVSVSTIVSLGTTALNSRIAALSVELLARLKVEDEKNAALRGRLAEMMRNDPEKARAQAMAILTGAQAASEAERALARYELLTKINPALWNAIVREFDAKVESCVKSGKCADGIAWLQAYPRVRTYPEEIDAQYKAVREAAIGMGVPSTNAVAIMEHVAAITAEAEHLASYEDKVVNGRKPGVKIPVEKSAVYLKAVGRCRSVLVRNGCTIDNADKIINLIHTAFSNETAKIESEVGDPVLYLGANAINVRLVGLRKSKALSLVSRCVTGLVEAGKLAEARKLLRSIPLTGDDDFDLEVYAIRIGALNALVNPVELKTRQPEIERKVRAFCAAGDYRGLQKWMNDYAYVHDRCADILKSLEKIRQTMLSFKVVEKDVAEVVDRFDAQIQEILDKAGDGRAPEVKAADIAEAERVVAVLQKALLAQYYDRKKIEKFCLSIRTGLELALHLPDVEALSVWELNAKLRGHMEATARASIAETISAQPKYQLAPDPVGADAVRDALIGAAQKGLVALAAGKKDKQEIVAEMSGGVSKTTVEWVRQLCDEINRCHEACVAEDAAALVFDDLLKKMIDRQDYLEHLAAVDREISYDSQIAIAEDAIAKELDADPEETQLQLNAVLGEYARAMRMLKGKSRLNGTLGAALVAGAVILDQPAVLDRAMELGADVNSVSARDPLGRTPLLLAVQIGRGAMIRQLASKNASVGAKDTAGNTILHYAVRRGNLGILKSFVGKVDVNVANKSGETSLFDAVRADNAAAVKVLLAASAKVKIANVAGLSVMDVACAAGACGVLEDLAGAGAPYGVPQLVLAVSEGRMGTVRWLVERGVDVNGEGVMKASEKQPVVRDYLLHEGGIGSRLVTQTAEKTVTNEVSTVNLNLSVDSVKVGTKSAVTSGKGSGK